MSKINKGKIVGDVYRKYVNFNKAVLWKSREISINKEVAEQWITNAIKWIEFIDRNKKQIWRAKTERVKRVWYLKKEGQEPQYYIPIEVFVTKDLEKRKTTKRAEPERLPVNKEAQITIF